jgi:hypothetical protein
VRMVSLRAHGWIGAQLQWVFGPSARLGFQEEELASNEIVLEVWAGEEGGIVKSEERSYQFCSGWGLYGVRGGFIQEVF